MREKGTRVIQSEQEGTDNFILVLVERSYFTTRASRRYHGFSGYLFRLWNRPFVIVTPPSSRRTDFPFAEGFLEHNSGACIHLPRGPARCTARSPSIIITKVLQTRRRVKTIRISRAGNYDVVRSMPRLLLRLLSRRARALYACSQWRQCRLLAIDLVFFSRDFLSTFLRSRSLVF